MSDQGTPKTADESSPEVTVLYVEDNNQTGPLVREWLERHDRRFEVSLAHSLGEAYEKLAETAFDAVVADYRFPGGTGLELLSTVRDQDPERPFLLYSGRVDENVKHEAAAAGVSAVIEKGNTNQLELLAKRILSGVENRSPPERTVPTGELDETIDELVHDLRGSLSVAYGHLDLLETDDEHVDGVYDALVEIESTVDGLRDRLAATEEEP